MPETTTLYVRKMPREAARELKAQAARLGLTLPQYLTILIKEKAK